MLIEKPNSKALKEKLANMRSMGSSAGADEELATPVRTWSRDQSEAAVKTDTPILFEAPAESAATNAPKRGTAPGIDVEATEYAPPPDAFDAIVSAPDFAPSEFAPVEYAPVEYVAPAEPVETQAPPAERELPVQAEEQAPLAQTTSSSRQQQTIVNLENWLKNIMKEK